MTLLEVFDPPMCCSSGVCGPDVDPRLASFAADIDWLVSQGVRVTRHNLAQEPQAFVAHPLVRGLLQRDGDGCLPVLIGDGEVVWQGTYPRRDELAKLSGIPASASRTKPKIKLSSGGCCTPGSGCC
jgi:hypothetical protein